MCTFNINRNFNCVRAISYFTLLKLPMSGIPGLSVFEGGMSGKSLLIFT